MRLGFIGGGNMATAIAVGAVTSGGISPKDIYIYDKDIDKMNALCAKHGFNACKSQGEAEIKSDILILAVKPNVAPSVLSGINRANAIVSIVAGLDTQSIKNQVKGDIRVLRVMPNTPLMVGAGASAFAYPSSLNKEEYDAMKKLFSSLGIVVEADEKYFSAITGLSGSGPAYVYMFIEALSDAGVKHGLTRQVAKQLAAQTVLGAAKMVLDTDKHPAALKDDVCSPGGTTIEAVAVLEDMGFRGAILNAVTACVKKADNL